MKKTAKKFDCVEMKHEIQREMLKRYEAERDQHESFSDFINTRAAQSPRYQRIKKSPFPIATHEE